MMVRYFSMPLSLYVWLASKMSPLSTTAGSFQPLGKSASFVSARHIRPSQEVKNRCAFSASQITKKSSHILSTLLGFSLYMDSIGVHDLGSAMFSEVEKLGPY